MFTSVSGPSPAELREWTTRLGSPASADAVRVDRIRAIEELRAALAAAQALEVAALAVERRAAIEVEIATTPRPGVGSRRRREEADRQLVAEVARARRISPAQAQRFVTWSCSAPTDTPSTFQLLATGAVSEARARTVFQVSSPLSAPDRQRVDAEVAPELPGWGDRQVDSRTRAAVYRVDPAGACERAAYAANQRRVSLRPAPDCMAWLTALLPLSEAVACRAALEQAVTAARGTGDPRGRGQVMADTLVERVTGQAHTADVAVAIQLVITDSTLRGDDDEPGRFADGTPVPGPLARDLALGDAACQARRSARRSVRRLFADPAGRLVTAETRSRAFTPAMAELIRLRDGRCATPWCDAPIRHIDHDQPHTRGGPTSIVNGRGRCAWCNLTKADREPEPVETSAPPPPPPPPPPSLPPSRPLRRRRRSRLERRARRRIAAGRRPELAVQIREHREHRCTVQQ